MAEPFTVDEAVGKTNWGSWNDMTDYMRQMVGLAIHNWWDVVDVDGGGRQYLSGDQVVAEWVGNQLFVHKRDTFWAAAQAHRGDVEFSSLLPN